MARTRRAFHQSICGGLIAGSFAQLANSQDSPISSKQPRNIQQSVCKWCFRTLSVEELARGAAAIGMKSVEHVGDTLETARKPPATVEELMRLFQQGGEP